MGLGLFDGEANLGDNDTPLNGFISWTPAFYVRPKAEAISALETASATGLVTGTGTALHGTTNPTSEPTHSSSHGKTYNSSHSSSLGIGLVVGLGIAVALIAVGAFWFFWRRHKNKQAAGPGGVETGGVDGSNTAELSGTSKFMAELQGGVPAAGSSEGQAEVKPAGFHEMPRAPPEPKGEAIRTDRDQVHEVE